MLEKYQDLSVVNFDLLMYAGNLDNLKSVEANAFYKFVKGDVCDRNLIQQLFNDYSFDGVIHFAAESCIHNSVK